MKKKYIWKFLVWVLSFPVVYPTILWVNAYDGATKQPAVCGWPSEMMSQYFDFQNEVKSVLLWSNLSERRFSTYGWNEWLFTSWILELPSALDFVASNVEWQIKSTVSTAATSIVLFALVSASVLQSNTEWFAILFKDRPIVRDYKQMLDIESELFDLAYFYSKKINLTLTLDWDVYDKLNELIKKYKKSWLLDDNSRELKKTESFADILTEFVDMNTAMKHFILFLGKPWTKALENYNWCFWDPSRELCTSNNSVLRFSENAKNELKESYAGLWTFWACNSYASNFKRTISKSVNNNSESVKAAFQDVKDAMKRLKWALIGDYEDSWDWKNKVKKNWNRCNLSEYEMAQLRAYRWSNWECWKWIDLSVALPKLWEYERNRQAQNEQRSKTTNVLKKSAATTWPNWTSVSATSEITVAENLERLSSDNQRRQYWIQTYWTWTTYNPEFIYSLQNDMVAIYGETMQDYSQIQQNAMASDLAYELRKIRWLIDQVWATMRAADILRGKLQAIADYQCAS